ncbi:MAG: cephalosporin hydroxylase family protein [Actinomycetota bacterium]|nr:cephalosporin hydroxylase family protein [Actinomycetota bacterium]
MSFDDVDSRPPVDEQFFERLVEKTDNFGRLKWLGQPIWQNLLDLWTIQETIWEVRPALLVETGTNRGGSAYFFAQLFELMNHGRVLTYDVEKLHDLSHPRIEFVLASSTGADAYSRAERAAAECGGPVMVILDSDHGQENVTAELELYSGLVTPGSYILVQDGVIDTLPMFAAARPGPLPAIHSFLSAHPEFELDRVRSERFLVTHHPDGWLRRCHPA